MAEQADTQETMLDEKSESFLIFRIDSSWYALHSSLIHKVLPHTPITFIPGCPEHVLGIIHIRGDIESVIDLRTIFGLGMSKAEADSRILITETEEMKTGIVVDHIEDITDIPVSRIDKVLSTLPDRIKALAKGEFPYGEKQVIIIDASALSQAVAGNR